MNDDPAPPPTFEAARSDLEARFLRRLRDRTARIALLLDDLRKGIPAAADDLAAIAHQLAGSAGTFGFPQVGTAAERLEADLRTFLAAAAPLAQVERSARTLIARIEAIAPSHVDP